VIGWKTGLSLLTRLLTDLASRAIPDQENLKNGENFLRMIIKSSICSCDMVPVHPEYVRDLTTQTEAVPLWQALALRSSNLRAWSTSATAWRSPSARRS
jgi:hypothetical protein